MQKAMNILAFDTTLNKTYIALLKGNSLDTKVIESDEKNYHSAYLISAIKNITEKNGLKLQELDLIAVNNGPGSFTGIRVGVTVAKTLYKELGVNAFGVSSLDILQEAYKDAVLKTQKTGITDAALNSAKPDVILDARKELFYFKNSKNAVNCPYNSESKGNIDLVPYTEIQNYITQNVVICDASSFSKLKSALGEHSEINIINFEEDDINLALSLLNLAKEVFQGAADNFKIPEGQNAPNEDFAWYTLKPRYIQPPPIHKKQ